MTRVVPKPVPVPPSPLAESQDSSGQALLFSRDVDQFGVGSAIALSELCAETAQLNRTYLECIAERSLRVLPEIESWCGYRVRVFLRHDNVFVFAIAFQSWIGMANSVVLSNVRFCVDLTGREQTNSKCGPLKNQSTVHAWVQGTLTRVSNDAWAPEADAQSIVYRPDRNEQFVLQETSQPVFAASDVFMVPGRCKVWARDVITTPPNALKSGGGSL